MISQLEGTLLYRGLDHVVLSVGGVGFHVIVSLPTLATLTEVGGKARLFTQLHVREDALTLFGFATEDERTAFELCLSVQGVGPKVGMAILSTLEPLQLAAAVRSGDHARLQRVPGVGKKTAERLALELRDKLDKAGLFGGGSAASAKSATPQSSRAQAIASALGNLGYRPNEATVAAERVLAEAGTSNPPLDQLVRQALRLLAE